MPARQTPAKAAPARRDPRLCRSWLFLPGADAAVLKNAPASGADVLIQELEDFTPPERRAEARALAPALYDRWRAAGAFACVRINPLDADGAEDLAAAMPGRPDAVFLPKVSDPEQIERLDQALDVFEAEVGITQGSTPVVPNVESALGLLQTYAIAKASPRVIACLVAAEDMAADLGAERAPDGLELAYARQRFLVECTAASVVRDRCTLHLARRGRARSRYALGTPPRLQGQERRGARAGDGDQSRADATAR